MINNKRGQMSILFVFLILALLFFEIVALVGGIVAVRMNNALDQDIDIGNVNLRDVNNDTFGQFATMFLNNADWWGISLIAGTIIGLFLSAYLTRGFIPKWGIILDIFIIIGMFVFSLYISSIYGNLLDSLSVAGETFLEDYTPKTSLFLLNLPIFTVIIGVISMVLFHSSIPKKTEELYQEGGYLQGVY